MFDDTNVHYSDSDTTTLTEQQPVTEGQTEQSTAPDSVHDELKQEEPKADDFASALESFTTESEEAQGEDHVIKGTVVKLTGTHVAVDIGAKSEGMVRVVVTGHTDTVGSDTYNQALSERRANAVKDEMVGQGMDGSTIAIEGKSFHDPLVPTGPGVREPQNRRAVIDLGG